MNVFITLGHAASAALIFACAAFFVAQAQKPEDGPACLRMCVDCLPFCASAPGGYVPPRP